MTTTAERNRKIKQVLSLEFGAGKVSARGSRGTAHGWVTVDIDYAPADREELETKKARVWELFKENNIVIGTYGYDSPGSDYGHGSTIHINFAQCRDVFNAGERVTYCGKPGVIKDRDYRTGGDWYVVTLDDGTVASACYKKDLQRVAGV